MTRKFSVLIAVAILALMFSATAKADEVDPPLIRFGDCQPSCAHLYNGEVVGVPGNGVTVVYQSEGGGHTTLTNPILIIIGIPNDTSGTAAPGITSVSTGTGMLGGTNTYSGVWNTSTGYAGNLTSGVVYDLITLYPGGSNSQSFVNWSNAVNYVTGMTVTGFGIYVYTLTGQNFDPGESFVINFAANLPAGTMLVGYGCDATKVPTSGPQSGNTICDGAGNTFSTPFTESGMVTPPVPEPGTLVLFGTGLIGLAGVLRRRMSL